VAYEDGVLALGTAGENGQRWPGAWVSTDDGVTWTAVHPSAEIAPRGRDERNQGETFEDAVVVGGQLVVMGHRDDGEERDITVWRFSLDS
jgi:hypothetical protein